MDTASAKWFTWVIVTALLGVASWMQLAYLASARKNFAGDEHNAGLRTTKVIVYANIGLCTALDIVLLMWAL